MQRSITLRLQAMAGSTHYIELFACGGIAGCSRCGLRERRMAGQPRLKGALFFHDEFARHGGTAKLWLTYIERSSSLTGLPTGRCSSEPDIKTSSCPLGSSGFMPNGFLSVR